MNSDKSNEGMSSAADPARDFQEFWKNYFEQTAIQTRILFENAQGGKSLDQLHSQGLAALSQSLESFMRTPAFLEVLKLSLKRMIDLKLMQDQMVQTFAQQAGLPLTADIMGVLEQIRRAEQLILKRLAELDGRLRAIEEALNSGSAGKSAKRKQATPKNNSADAPDDPAG